MEEDLKDVCLRKKFELMWHTSATLGSAMKSYQIAVEKKPVLLRIMVKEAGGFDHPVFSDFYTLFKDLDDCSMDAEKSERLDNLPLGILIEKDSLFYASFSDVLNSEILDTYLNPGFQFSNDPETFLVEFFTVLKVFSVIDEGSDPRVDLAAMKALFHAGRMIERLEHEGRKRSDMPAKAGSTKHKGYVSDQDVIQAAKEVSKRLKSKRDIARVVRKRLLKDESEKENPKKVFKEDHIRNVILKEVWPEIL
ncbi:MAG: hypothetical protein H8D55_02530 [Deltaproteobacteria bacterium]|nr:hypothetical protein [Deltaproteobacteria bacterium]MBL7217186.1 hypothetical protein [Desulfobacteraceae bacterium]